jgi:maleate isomerase
MIFGTLRTKHSTGARMTAGLLPFEVVKLTATRLGLMALQSDETIESDTHRFLPRDIDFMVSRVPYDDEFTRETLGSLEGKLGRPAG